MIFVVLRPYTSYYIYGGFHDPRHCHNHLSLLRVFISRRKKHGTLQ